MCVTCLHVYLSTSSCRANCSQRKIFVGSREKTRNSRLGDDDILTHEAADIAYALGVKVIRETDQHGSVPKERDVNRARLALLANLPPLKVVRMANVQVEPFLKARPRRARTSG